MCNEASACVDLFIEKAMDRRIGHQQQQQSRRDHRDPSSSSWSSSVVERPATPIGCEMSSMPASPGRQRVTTTACAAAATVAATLSPLLAAPSRLITARRSWSPQHQSSLEVPTPRMIQSARNSLAATAGQQSSVEVHYFLLLLKILLSLLNQ